LYCHGSKPTRMLTYNRGMEFTHIELHWSLRNWNLLYLL